MVMVLLVTLGISAGFFVVPMNELIQNRPRPEEPEEKELRLWHPGPRARVPDRLGLKHWHGICAGADAAGAMAKRATLDEAATTG
jgi:hypothetical protein